jgi:hypothetical protein
VTILQLDIGRPKISFLALFKYCKYEHRCLSKFVADGSCDRMA